MNHYTTPKRPDPRIRANYVDAALKTFHQVQETGQGQVIFLTGTDGSGYPQTLQAIDERLGEKLGFVYHSKRVLGFNCENRHLTPWRNVDRAAWLGYIGTLLPIIQAVPLDPFLNHFTGHQQQSRHRPSPGPTPPAQREDSAGREL